MTTEMVTAGVGKVAPGPKGYPVIGVLPALAKDPFQYLMRMAAQYEGLVRIGVGPIDVFLVSHPDYVHQVLVSKHQNYHKGQIMSGIRMALGNGLFTSDGDFWGRQRRLMQPAFHQGQIRQMADTIVEETHTCMEKWQPALAAGRQPIDILKEMVYLNIRIVLRNLFGTSVTDADAVEMLKETDEVFLGMSKRLWAFFVPPRLPVPGQAAYQRAIRTLDRRVYSLISKRRASGEERQDLLGLILAMRDADTGERMTDAQVRDEIFTLFMAGYESTATGITWACYLLSQHTEVERKMQAELQAVLGGRAPVLEDLSQLPYMRMVVDEAFRLYPAFPMFFRTCVAGDLLGPYKIPAGASIILSPYATHHNPVYWPDPERFDPERFLPERFTESLRNAYYPFGKGQRLCIGRPLALTAAQLILSTLIQKYHLELMPGSRIEPRFALTFQPRYGMPMFLQPR